MQDERPLTPLIYIKPPHRDRNANRHGRARPGHPSSSRKPSWSVMDARIKSGHVDW